MIKRIYPSPEECKVKNCVECTQEGCTKVFKSDSNLNLHLAKTHGQSELLHSNGEKQYHCPEIKCIYHEEKYLKNMKFLRQHYLKVHSKRSSCRDCQRSFTSEKSYNAHIPYCGVKFSCSDCKVSYSSYETLQTHGRRKKHLILSKQEYILNIADSTKSGIIKKHRFLLPKSVKVIIVSNSNTNKLTQDQGCQTTGSDKMSKMTGVNKDKHINKTSQQTQTLVKPKLLSIGTQTDQNSSFKQEPLRLKNQKTSDTQTDLIEPSKIHEKIPGSSSSTQTYSDFNLYAASEKINNGNINSALIGDSTLNNGMNNFEFDNCHMETQTDFIFEDIMFSNDYLMSNMYTQTCDDVLNQFNFNDIQTQTVFDDDMLKSVESQTFMSLRMQNGYGCKDMSHTETQTDAEFRQMLEVINS